MLQKRNLSANNGFKPKVLDVADAANDMFRALELP